MIRKILKICINKSNIRVNNIGYIHLFIVHRYVTIHFENSM